MNRPVNPYDAIARELELDPVEFSELRQQGLADPPRGCPMKVKDKWGEEHDIEPGGWREAGFIGDDGALPYNCPIIPLGQDEQFIYVLSPLGHVRMLKENVGKTALMMAFGGRVSWLEWAYPRWSKGTETSPAEVTGFAAENLLIDLINACAWKGGFAIEDHIRGRGAWRDDDGSLIYHAGDRVLIQGRWRACGEYNGHIYAARPKLGRPAAKYEAEGEGSPGDNLLGLLRTFNWDRGELDARLTLGWLMTAKVGGALRRRPVQFVNGEEGSGKSTLQELLRLAMNGALMSTSNTTQAGIYQKIRQDSVAILVDEMESKEDNRVVDKILELARIAYSGDKMQRGGQDGQGKEFALMSSFMGSSIAKPATNAQDDSRMVVCLLRPLIRKPGVEAKEIDTRTIEQWAADVAADSPISAGDVDLWGRQLLRRWFEWWPRWGGLLRVFRQALLAAGHDDRSADTFSPLAAACHVALRDTLPEPAELKEWMEWLRADQLVETATKEKTWRRCFMHLLGATPRYLEQQASKSVGAALEAFKADPMMQPDEVNRRLAMSGLALSWPKAGDGGFSPQAWDTARLFVPAKSAQLFELFAGTPWQGHLASPGPWIGVLRQMDKGLWENGKCDKGLDRKASGIFINLADALA
ncbi:hypothetical protein [Caulobacter hibisci]|uniref:DNA primase n=1 Tax=Caulobacter hibisci TaxID=2035993 RepID=A0ABS0SXU6_9CAUL|nr:hypothetical protein [Caulobacter hibisci]MBI1684446.1 hypothetical protein [Caulobacter hibisci]